MKQRITLGDWSIQRANAADVRHEVFVVEQNVPLELELDDLDAVSVHVVAFDEHGQALGTGRLLPDGHIGRMAVRSAYRQGGVGGVMLHALMEEAKKRGLDAVVLNAQVYVRTFYERHGFTAEGDEFMDAGIPHIRMRHVFQESIPAG